MPTGPVSHCDGKVNPMNAPCSIIIPLIKEFLQLGSCVRMTATGSSMWPFLRNGDIIEISSIGNLPVRPGEIVLAIHRERYLLHRVIQINMRGIFIAGDAQSYFQGPIAPDMVLGRVVALQRGSALLKLNRLHWRIVGCVWAKTFPLGPRLINVFYRIYVKIR